MGKRGRDGARDTTLELVAKNVCIHWYLVLDKNQTAFAGKPK